MIWTLIVRLPKNPSEFQGISKETKQKVRIVMLAHKNFKGILFMSQMDCGAHYLLMTNKLHNSF